VYVTAPSPFRFALLLTVGADEIRPQNFFRQVSPVPTSLMEAAVGFRAGFICPYGCV